MIQKGETRTISAVVPIEVHARLKRLAKAQGRSMTKQLLYMMEWIMKNLVVLPGDE